MPDPEPKRVLIAPDKFRSTASAPELRAALGRAAEAAGYVPLPCAIADGGEGLLEAMGGEAFTTEVTGPLGTRVDAEWRRLDDPAWGATAVIEMARASGLALVGDPKANDPVGASTYGTGELVRTAVEAGARTVVVGCGGSATTDGGLGALEAIGESVARSGARLLVACDVRTRFLDAARVFGPQKGATAEQVEALTARLAATAAAYRARFGIDVTRLDRAGAAGGLAGGLAALGGELVSGVTLVAEHLGLDRLIASCELVITGEGRLDATSLEGKVVGELIDRCRGRRPLLVIVGRSEIALAPAAYPGVEVISLVERCGEEAALGRTVACLEEVARAALAARALGSS